MPAHYKTLEEALTKYLSRRKNEELKGQSSKKYYRETKDKKEVCDLCGARASDRKLCNHRINPSGIFSSENTIIVCNPCRFVIQRIYNDTNATSKNDYRLAITVARLEVKENATNDKG